MVMRKKEGGKYVEYHPCWVCDSVVNEKRKLRNHLLKSHHLHLSYYGMAKTALKEENGEVVQDNAWEVRDYIYSVDRMKFIGLFTTFFMEKKDLRVSLNESDISEANLTNRKVQLARRMASLLRLIYLHGLEPEYKAEAMSLRVQALNELGRYGFIKTSEMYIAYIAMEGKRIIDKIIRAHIESGKTQDSK